MNEDQVAYDPNWKRHDKQREVRERVMKVRMFFYGLFWKVLFLLHIAIPVSKMMCRLNIYSKFGLSGRCQWCGEVHGIHWRIKQPNYGGIEKALEELPTPTSKAITKLNK